MKAKKDFKNIEDYTLKALRQTTNEERQAIKRVMERARKKMKVV